MPVFCLVDAGSFCAENTDSALVESEGKVVRNLTAHGNNDSVRLLQLVNIHNPLKCKFIEVETVAHIVVGRDCLRVVVYHHSPVALIPDCLKSIDRTPVEFDRTSDAVSS